MDLAVDTFLTSWRFDPWLAAGLLATAVLYLRGWLSLRAGGANRWQVRHLAAFAGGLGLVYLALASPIEAYAPFLLQVHMAQHLLLMMAVPPLAWLAEPLVPLIRGLPAPVRTYWVAPLFRWPAIRRPFEVLTRPAPALLLFTIANWVWHLPPLYEAALRSDGWHYLQHVCFLVAGLIFWYPVVRPFPARPRWSEWQLIPFLILADVQNTVLSALLTFSNHVLYPYYEEVPRLYGLSALDDQAAAGVLMWVPGSVAYLVPLFVLGVRIIYGSPRARRVRTVPPSAFRPTNGPQPVLSLAANTSVGAKWTEPVVSAIVAERPDNSPRARRQPNRFPLPLPLAEAPPRRGRPGFDALRLPVAGALLRSVWTRRAAQVLLLAMAVVVIVDGLTGPQVGAMNLAGVLPWVHWRGVLILGLMTVGNVFCFACPFTLPRALARRWLLPTRVWPQALRSKWLAVALLALFLWAYEAFSLWDSPWWTAWIAVGYFAAAFVVDSFFQGASFCKYVCPIGQFNFVQSLLSPLEVKVRDASTCATCTTRDCIRGRDDKPGCQTGLFQPRKSGNLDCTFCLDCVRACPHDNVGVLAVVPGAELWRNRFRSGIGWVARRTDLAALVGVLVFGAFVNAAGMVAPVVRTIDAVSVALGQQSTLLATTLFYALGLVAVPLLAIGGSGAVSRRWGRLKGGLLEVATQLTYTLVPLGFGMWLAHYSFHLLTGYDAVLPAGQRFAGDWGWRSASEPDWIYACCRPVAAWLTRAEILSLDIGYLLSLYAAFRLARDQSPRPLRALAPLALLMTVLFAVGVWTVLQPMQMRGTLPAGR
jgi:cytochrome c oxidase assembly factor CtaG/ferredoxin